MTTATRRGYDRLLTHSKKMAKARNEAWCIAEMDGMLEARVLQTMALAETYYDEFIAWAGVVMVIVEVDGSVEDLRNDNL